jgi:hypothetical protein
MLVRWQDGKRYEPQRHNAAGTAHKGKESDTCLLHCEQIEAFS